MEYILLIFIYFLSFFIVGTVVKNNSIVDIGWGIGFVFVAWYRLFTDTEATLPVILMATLISIWGLRLFYHISKRNIGKGEDFRYAKWRKDWGKWLIPRAFFQIYMLQGLFLFIIALPMILTPSGEKEHSWPLIAAGLAIWSFGFFFEAVGDYQLKVFLKDSLHRGQLMTTGLWRYTRHPNYFGEATMWWGIFFLSLAGGASALAILSPITITFLLVRVSGVPLLEESMKKKPGYEEYARKTSVFVPWFPKKLK